MQFFITVHKKEKYVGGKRQGQFTEIDTLIRRLDTIITARINDKNGYFIVEIRFLV